MSIKYFRIYAEKAWNRRENVQIIQSMYIKVNTNITETYEYADKARKNVEICKNSLERANELQNLSNTLERCEKDAKTKKTRGEGRKTHKKYSCCDANLLSYNGVHMSIQQLLSIAGSSDSHGQGAAFSTAGEGNCYCSNQTSEKRAQTPDNVQIGRKYFGIICVRMCRK